MLGVAADSPLGTLAGAAKVDILRLNQHTTMAAVASRDHDSRIPLDVCLCERKEHLAWHSACVVDPVLPAIQEGQSRGQGTFTTTLACASYLIRIAFV